MSYFTIKHIKGNPYLYEVRSEREGDRVRQVFVRYLGRADRADAVERRVKAVRAEPRKAIREVTPLVEVEKAMPEATPPPVEQAPEVPTVDEALRRFEEIQTAEEVKQKYGIDVTKATEAEYVKAGLASFEKELEGTGFPLDIKKQTQILKEEYSKLAPEVPVIPEEVAEVSEAELDRIALADEYHTIRQEALDFHVKGETITNAELNRLSKRTDHIGRDVYQAALISDRTKADISEKIKESV